MTRPVWFRVVVLLVLVVVGLTFKYYKTSNKINSDNKTHFAAYSQSEFYTGLANPDSIPALSEQVYGGIVSHHFFMEKDIAQFFLAMRRQKPKTVVIVGPNHFNAGRASVLTSKHAYNTPWGNLEPDLELIEKLQRQGLVQVEEQPFQQEHSISTLVGFVKNVFPEVKFVPIIIKPSASTQRLDELANSLNKLLPDDSLVLASVDFSHHLNRTAADFHDQTSIVAIQNFDYERIAKLEIDSPASIRVLLKYLEQRGAQKLSYKNTNSALASKNLESEDVTSYVFGHFSKGTRETNDAVSVLSFGDSMLGCVIGQKIEAGFDPFAKIQGVEGNFLKGVDVITANLEGVITDKCEGYSNALVFPARSASLFKKYRFNLLNLANNHSLDCGVNGLAQTKKGLDKVGVGYFGSSTQDNGFVTKRVKDKTVVFGGLNALSLSAEQEEKYLNQLKQLKAQHDYVVVNVHWGVEYNTSPSPAQIQLAHKLIDSGADLIIGHHPHVIQPVEVYKNKAIFYSLGNFVFDQELPETKQGIGVGAVLEESSTRFYLFPFKIDNYQPRLLNYIDAKSFCDNYLKQLEPVDACVFELRQ